MVLQTIVASIFLIWYSVMQCGTGTTAQQPTLHVISFFFIAKGDSDIEDLSANELAEVIEFPGSAERAMLRQRELALSISGIWISHEGSITHSDINGQVLLPLTEPTEEINILIVKRPKPVLTHGNTIDYWEISKNQPAKWYQLKRKTRGKSTVWQIRKISPPSTTIPPHTIIIRIDPEAIEVPEGTFPTESGLNLILPNIYITGKRASQPSTLNTISTSRFFTSTHRWSAFTPERYVTVIT